ncbi:MAG: hypothetical protein IT303_05720 [Dehalococcoidia bacterium]|nr:hypothetical protein [Dehalococcoidia bacterium]
MATGIKEDALKLVHNLPDGATWDDLFQKVYERIIVEKSLAELREGRSYTTAEVRQRLGL